MSLEIAVFAFILLASVILHELCHGLAANAMGDFTAKAAGRLTLNPVKHIDLFMTILLPAFLYISTQGRFAIGMAKPVPVNFALLRNQKAGMIGVALAGPLTNFVLAALSAFAWRSSGHPVWLYAAYLNVGLAVFNMIPIPPLDGSRVLAGILPSFLTVHFFKMEKIGYALILILYFTGSLMRVVVPLVDWSGQMLGLPKLEGVL